MPNSVIAEDLTIDGHIKSGEGSVEVKGKVIGDVAALSVVIRAGASVKGAVAAKTTIIEGKHKGRLKSDDLSLSPTASVQANVSARTITVKSGAAIDGAMHVSGKT
ncbi:MAG: polymer-forming cytoskeletal protein [Rhodobiaceae bacterium]|jgi:cytoskeletal protein CcmA (bactofilin family)|nr:polymer-forming cytoskeletal protein [Rhodobiaceae bacterium]